MLMVFTAGGIVPWSFAQVPDLEALERQLEERKSEEARQQARRAEEARRAAERCLQNRFEVVNEGVSDCQQNIIWAESDSEGKSTWPNAMSYCRAMGPGWSLPSVSQLQSLFDPDTPFSKPITETLVYTDTGKTETHTYTIYPVTNLIPLNLWYWSAEANGSSEAWLVGLVNGDRFSSRQSRSHSHRALCVRRP